MSLSRLFKGFQGKFNNAVEEAADNNLVSELEQRIRDAEKDQRTVDDKTAEIMGKTTVLQDEIDALQGQIDKYLPQLREVHAKDENSPMVQRLTDKLNDIKAQMDSKKPLLETYEQASQKLLSQKRKNEDGIKNMKMELEQLKSNETLIEAKKANAELVGDLTGSVASAGDASRRLKERQAAEMAKLDAQAELSGSSSKSLDDELAEMGIGNSGAKSASDWL